MTDDPASGLRLMATQMLTAASVGLHFPALMTALALPDICGALGSENGRASGAKTRRWITDWMPSSEAIASAIYGLRCSLLHQGSPYPDDGSPRVVFSVAGPSGIDIHAPGAVIQETTTGQRMRPIAVKDFTDEVARGVESWLAAYGSTSTVRRNFERFAHQRRDGVPPFFAGGSFIA